MWMTYTTLKTAVEVRGNQPGKSHLLPFLKVNNGGITVFEIRLLLTRQYINKPGAVSGWHDKLA